MRVLVLNEHEVHELLTMGECIGVMEEALASLARGEAYQPLRNVIRAPGANGFLGLMPAFSGEPAPSPAGRRRGGGAPLSLYGLKEVCVFPGNPARGLDTHLGAVLLHSGETGELLAILNASAITAIRTAAVSAVATKFLAREDASVLAILGSGVQARSHRESIPLVRSIKEVRMYSRSKQENCASAEEAVRGADIVVTATSSREPVLRREWIAPGTHINAVGSSIAAARELDGATVAGASLFVDRRESTVNESGDYLFALKEGAIKEGHIRSEIGEIVIGKVQGRTSRDEITLFKSLGLAIEDLAAAAFLYDKAGRLQRGTVINF